VSQQTTNIWSEAVSAARGVAGLIIGNREAPARFDLTGRGLATSFIAVLLAMTLGLGVQMLFGLHGQVLRSVAALLLLSALQIGCSAIALWQAKRLDGLVPYLVADNWASFYITTISLVLHLVGIGDEFTGFPIGVLTVVLAVNIGRLVVGLAPLQVAMFVVAQVVGYLIGLFLVPLLLPLPALTALSS
jgi:hypothetical protein